MQNFVKNSWEGVTLVTFGNFGPLHILGMVKARNFKFGRA